MTKTTHILPVVTLVLACIVATAVFTPPAYAHHIIASALIIPQTILALPESTVNIDDARIDLVTIPPGSFMMGSDSGDGDERPVHKVTINYSFDLGKTEVTVAQFKAFTKATGYKTQAEKFGGVFLCPSPDKLGYDHKVNWQNSNFPQTPDHPATCLSYYDAIAFCKWLCEKTGENYRLPTETEWEYACRAGSTTNQNADIEQITWFDMTSPGHPSPVAQKNPNPWGLYDMQGNVAEWCCDKYHFNYNHARPDGTVNNYTCISIPKAARRVLRGGSWCSPKSKCTPSFRLPAPSIFTQTGTGFRIVRLKKPESATPLPAVETPPKIPNTKNQLPETDSLSVNDIDFNFVRIDPGTFVMGSDSNYIDQYGWKYEFDKHPVTIDYNYYLATTEVTLEQFTLFVEQTGYATDAEKHGFVFTCIPEGSPWHYQILADWQFPGFIQTDSEPVTHITWYDAVEFCAWLSEKTDRDIRLPTEAEWEYACRAGSTGNYAASLNEMGWNQWNCEFRTHPVAQKKPNTWGLYDMHGNVWEWVLDLWTPNAEDVPHDGSPNLDSPRHDIPGVIRGGSFANPPWLCASHSRMRITLGPRAHYNNGFRIAMSPKN